MASRVVWTSNFTAASRALAAELARLQKEAPAAMGRALYREAEDIMARSKEIYVPVKTGALRRSGYVEEPTITSTTATVVLGFGGAAAPYAVYVHERQARHEPPTQWKYLEVPMNDALGGMAERLATSARAELGL